MSFEGTRFEKLANSIKNEVSRKRRGMDRSDGASQTSKKSRKGDEKERKAPVPPEPIVKRNVLAKQAPVKAATSQAAAVDSAAEPYCNDRTVYIEGLPFEATDEQIAAFFKDVGDVKSIRLPRWHDSGKLKGYGHVEFKKADSATKALDLDGGYLGERYLSIARPQVPRAVSNPIALVPSEKPAGCRTVFVKNLPYETTEAEVTAHFRVFGHIKSVRLAMWNHTGKQKGIGYIDFKKEDSAETAVKKSGTIEMQGRKILVDYETGAPKASFKLDVDKKKGDKKRP
jgi:RNA recognition motif-containing protein